MQGLVILILSFILTFVISKTTDLKPLVNYKNRFEYIPIITSNLYADLLIVFITFSGILGYKAQSWKILTHWYKKYRLSAMLADIIIGVLYLLLARYIAYSQKWKLNLFEFGALSVAVQLVFDFAFYLMFSLIPKNQNHMLDMFKNWARYAKLDALWGDSILVLFGVVVSSLLNQKSFDFNIVALIIGLYLVPYTIYMKN
jgi:hypothetical protein|tara:strand:- start:57 stop:656 length:600 start_codon:yes stop_codon:yes gene_type:complete